MREFWIARSGDRSHIVWFFPEEPIRTAGDGGWETKAGRVGTSNRLPVEVFLPELTYDNSPRRVRLDFLTELEE